MMRDDETVVLKKYLAGRLPLAQLAAMMDVDEREAARQAEEYRLEVVRARLKGVKLR